MKAVQYSKFGGPEVLDYVTDAARPKVGKGEVLIKVTAAGVNPVDYKLREGMLVPFAKLIVKLPKIPGGELAGTIEEGSAKFSKGDKVFAHVDALRKDGTTAEYVRVAEKNVVKVPTNISLEEAAGIPLAGCTAWQALESAKVKEGSRVLIQAGAGGVGSLAIQIAKAWGATVATTCSTRNVDFVKSLGADEVCDYTKNDLEAYFKDKPFDAIVECMGGASEVACKKLLKKGARLQSIMSGATPLPTVVYSLVASSLGFGPGYGLTLLSDARSGDDLAKLAELIQAGKVKPIVDKVFPLEKTADAHRIIAEGHVRGKLVIKVD